MVKQIDKSALTWRGNAPVSSHFDDVYYSEENGQEETEFVFLKGINAPDCWVGKDNFVIAETGFGTGLNFMVTWKAWLESGAKGTLTFISVEKYPLSFDALAEAHKTFPELAPYSKELCNAWPPPAPGLHPRNFANGKIKLFLLFGDAADAFSELSAKVDAWYLDGFAPAKNPEMWTDELFDQIAQLSRPETSFATFTAAGFVRRALQARGFHVDKVKGYGRKRERLVGYLNRSALCTPSQQPSLPEWATPPIIGKTSSTLIIGAGIAGSSLATALSENGHTVTLLSNEAPSGSDVPAAILSPSFQRSDQPAARFATTCFAHACCYPFYDVAWASGHGVRLSSTDTQERKRLEEVVDKLDWGDDWLIPLEDGYFLPKSGALNPKLVLENLQKTIKQVKGTVTHIEYLHGQWHAHTADNIVSADNLVIACAMQSDLILGTDQKLELRPKPGQIEITDAATTDLPTGNHAYGGYVTSALNSEDTNRAFRTIGSTFDVQPKDGRSWPKPTQENRAANLKALKEVFGTAPKASDITASWAGVRATTPDYMPYVGPVPNWGKAAKVFAPLAKDRKLKGLGDMPYQKGLYLLSGFGAKGFQQAPLCAAYIAALICNEPLPLTKSLIPHLHPARHMIKSIVRTKSP